MSETLVVVGLACIIGAVVGGGLKLKGIEIPVISSVIRQAILAIVGIGVLIAAFTVGDADSPRKGKSLAISQDLSTTSGAARFVEFVQRNSGKTAQLDLLCVDHQSSACAFEKVGDWNLAWTFTAERCAVYEGQATSAGAPDLSTCEGGNVFWVDSTAGSNAQVATGPQGIGSYVIRGTFALRDDGYGGAIFGPNIHSYRLTPLKLPPDPS